MNSIAELHGCECADTPNCPRHEVSKAELAPVLHIIERNGKRMNVCSFCNLMTDKVISTFIPTKEHYIYDDDLELQSLRLSCYV